MVLRQVVELVDDVDGTPVSETVRFGLDAVGYELNLSPQNAAKLRATFAPYIAAGRRLRRSRTVWAQAQRYRAGQLRG